MLNTKVCGEKTAFINDWETLAIEANYQPSALAEMCGVSLRTLQRHSQREYQLTVIEWLTSIRLAKAREKLLAGERIKQVAHGLGYKRLSHFSRAFKNHFGFSPRTFQQTHLADQSIDLPELLALRRRNFPYGVLVAASANSAVLIDSIVIEQQ